MALPNGVLNSGLYTDAGVDMKDYFHYVLPISFFYCPLCGGRVMDNYRMQGIQQINGVGLRHEYRIHFDFMCTTQLCTFVLMGKISAFLSVLELEVSKNLFMENLVKEFGVQILFYLARRFTITPAFYEIPDDKYITDVLVEVLGENAAQGLRFFEPSEFLRQNLAENGIRIARPNFR